MLRGDVAFNGKEMLSLPRARFDGYAISEVTAVSRASGTRAYSLPVPEGTMGAEADGMSVPPLFWHSLGAISPLCEPLHFRPRVARL